MGRADVALHRLAARQHGLVTRGQARRLGLSPHQITRRVASGELQEAHRGVYAVAAVPASFEQALHAACLAGDGVASHRSAAFLWDLPSPAAAPEISAATHRRLAGVITHRVAELDPVDLTVRHGIPVTTAARTLLDLGAVASLDDVEAAAERALYLRLVTFRRMQKTLERLGRRGRGGTAALRSVVASRDASLAPTESVLELAMVRLISRHHLPQPVRQHWVTAGNGDRFRLDFAYPDLLLAIETDGRVCHSGPGELLSDRRRSRQLVHLGWAVLAFTWQEVVKRPVEVAGEVLAAVAARSAA